MSAVTADSLVLDHGTTHGIKNQLAIIMGFCDLLTRSLDQHDPRRHDVMRIETAGREALALLRDCATSRSGDHHDQR